MFKLNLNDFVKGAIVAVLSAVVIAFEQGLSKYGVSFSQYDWASIGNVALSAGVAYLSKNLFTADNGKVFGVIGK